MAHRDGPRNSAEAREVERSETRMPGALSLWLLSLCARKEKVTRRKGETSSAVRESAVGVRYLMGNCAFVSLSTPIHLCFAEKKAM